MKKLSRYINPVLVFVFAAVAVWLMAFEDADYLRKIEVLQIFQPSAQFFVDCFKLPGGMLAWLSIFLTQSFYHPWLGALAYIIIFICTAFLTLKTFRMPWKMLPVTLVIPAAELLALHNMGYVIFSLKTPGFAFMLPLGVLVALSLVWDYRRWGKFRERLVNMLIIPIVGYLLLGFYGLLATAVLCVLELVRIFVDRESPKRQSALLLALGAVMIAAVPQIYLTQVGGHLRLGDVYTVQLPWLYEGEGNLMIPYYVVAGALVLAAIVCPMIFDKLDNVDNIDKIDHVDKLGKLDIIDYLGKVIGLAAIASIFVFRYNDPNFKLSLALEQALWDGEFEEAVTLAEKSQDFVPTRLNVILTDMALLRTNQFGDRVFRMRIGSAPYTTQRSLRVQHDTGSALFAYHTGLINYAYHWAMECKVEYGLSVESLKMMAKCALLNGERKLAEKYLDNLAMTAFHGDWAEKYRAYLNNPEAMKKDREFAAIMPLIRKENKFIYDRGQLEGYVWADLATIETGSMEMLELAMTSSLICYKLDTFANLFPIYLQNFKRIPLHFQEAILFWGFQTNQKVEAIDRLDPAVVANFQRFVEVMKQTQRLGEAGQRDVVSKMFGNTYWYYCCFMASVMTVV